MTNRLLTYKDIMVRMSVGEEKARRLIRQMPCINVSDSQVKPRWRVTEQAFEQWIKAQQSVPAQTEAARLAALLPKPKRKRGWTYQGVS